ncbi:MAG TPA: glycosyltransferase family 4 protein [Clostridia bacterium]|nr:glycosyltransferase family 4 protein [Clostridia bacterium]
MRILYILPFVPWPVRVRSYNLIPRLAREHSIDLVCLATSAQDMGRLDEVRKYCASVRVCGHNKFGALARTAISLPTRRPLREAFFQSSAMRREVGDAIAQNQPDVIYVERWRALQYVPQECRVPIVCDPTDSMTLYNRRLMSAGCWWERIIGTEEYLKFRSFEPKLARRVASAVFCSNVDKESVQALAPDASCVQVANGVDCDRFYRKSEGEEDPETIFFSGAFGYRPNRHAVRYFIQHVYPLIRQERSNVRLVLVGNQASRFLLKEHRGTPGLQITDFVPELRPALASATVSIAPIVVGAGVSNKILEAFAVGTPMVATQMACGDLPVRHGEHLLLASTPREFADNTLALLSNRELRESLANAGRKLVEEQYDWEIVARHMESVLMQCAGVDTSIAAVASR